jgi:hypothetical protein
MSIIRDDNYGLVHANIAHSQSESYFDASCDETLRIIAQNIKVRTEQGAFDLTYNKFSNIPLLDAVHDTLLELEYIVRRDHKNLTLTINW